MRRPVQTSRRSRAAATLASAGLLAGAGLLANVGLLASAGLLANVGLERAAFAHPELSPVTVNRYLKLTLLSGSEVRLAYTVLYGAQPAALARRSADSNGDGALDDAEVRTLGAALAAQVRAGLQLRVDGRPVDLTARAAFDPPEVGLAGPAVAPEPFSVDLIAHVPVAAAPGPHTLTLDDTTALPSLGETELRIEESPTTRLVQSYRGPHGAPDERAARFLFQGPKLSLLEDRSVTVRWEGTTPAAKPSSHERWKLGGLVFAALLALALMLRRSPPPAKRGKGQG